MTKEYLVEPCSDEVKECNGTSVENVLDLDSAKRNFVKLLEYYDISFTFDIEKQTKLMKARDSLFNLIVDKIQSGKIEIIDLEDGNIGIKQYLSPRSKKIREITYRNASGSDAVEIQNKDPYAFLGAISKLGSKTIEKLTGGDLTNAVLIDTFFRCLL